PVYQYIQAACEQHHAEHPEFMAVHYVAADQVEECWQLLRQSMRSISWECLAHLPSYSAWLRQQDWTGAYRRHRRNLQLIGLPEAGRRWVLKNPSHLFALDALLRVYPDALVIQTHRDPGTARPSSMTCPTTTWRPIRWAPWRRPMPTSACRSAAPQPMPCGLISPSARRIGPAQRAGTHSLTSA